MRGCDIGTGFLVAASQDNNNQIQIKSIRDSFLDLEKDPTTINMLKMSKIDFIEEKDELYVVGENAMSLSNLFKREARRPLAQGVISPGELKAEKILLVLLENILGKAKVQNEICFFSVPGKPVDKIMDIVYHQAMFSKLISSLGYKCIPLNESAAIGYSNSAKEQFSCLAISHGCGMINVCLMYKTLIGMAFSICKAGDWIDQSAATAVGSTASRIQMIKEKGLNLLDPTEGDPKTVREREALIIYYKSLILQELDTIKNEFLKKQGNIELPTAIPIILSGGTSLPKGFKELFEEGFNTMRDKWPFQVSEIRLASDQLNATAQGLLVAAMNYTESQR